MCNCITSKYVSQSQPVHFFCLSSAVLEFYPYWRRAEDGGGRLPF